MPENRKFDDNEVRNILYRYKCLAKDDSLNKVVMEVMMEKYQRAAQHRHEVAKLNGKPVPLHEQSPLDKFISKDAKVGEKLRTLTVRDAKRYYHERYSLTKEFNKNAGKPPKEKSRKR